MPDIRRHVAARAARALLLTVVVLAGPAVAAGPASAHASLVDSNPAQDARLDAAPEVVELTFNEVVSQPAYLALKSPDGELTELTDPEIVDGTVSAVVGDAPFAGTYALSYRVVSADGHPIDGTITFEVLTGRAPSAPGEAETERSYLHRHRGHLLWGGLAATGAVALIAWPLVRRRIRS